MNSPTNEYLLLFRDTNWDEGMTPEQLRRTLDAIEQWIDGLQRSGRMKGGHPLGTGGHVLKGQKGGLVSDGPYAESKEAIGGYILVEAASLEEATEIARDNPVLRLGGTIEVRPALAECAVSRRALDRLALATA